MTLVGNELSEIADPDKLISQGIYHLLIIDLDAFPCQGGVDQFPTSVMITPTK